jgi:hypothetical protein
VKLFCETSQAIGKNGVTCIASGNLRGLTEVDHLIE